MFKFRIPDDCKEAHFAVHYPNYYFPVVFYLREKDLYLKPWLNYPSMDTISLIEWCKNHDIEYQIIYPLSIKQIFKCFPKFIQYLQIVIKQI